MRYHRNSSLSLCSWLLHTGINRKESANETNWVVCVSWKEQPVLSRTPSYSSVTGCLLSGLLFFSQPWLERGKVNQWKLFFPSSFPQDIPLLFSTLEAELGDSAQSQPALWCRVCTRDVPGFSGWFLFYLQLRRKKSSFFCKFLNSQAPRETSSQLILVQKAHCRLSLL